MKLQLKVIVCLSVCFVACRNNVSKSGEHTARQLTADMQEEVAGGYDGGFIDSLKTQDGSVNFLAVGDWGRNGQYRQSAVAEQMGRAAMTIGADFIVSTGDNFYPSGVASTTDPQWQTSFEKVYKAHALYENWYVVLGNHDYKKNPEAQIAYTGISGRWNMPDYFFYDIRAIDDDTTQKILLVYIDTNPFVKKYYVEEKYRKGVSRQDTAAQKKWLEQLLSKQDSAIKWRIVVGHHPLYCGGKRKASPDTYDIRNSFEPIFEKYNVDAYICGHEHDLQHIKPKGKTHYFVSGSGSEVRPTGEMDGSEFFAADFGFMTFSIGMSNMLVNVVNDKGNIIYTTNINK